MPRSIAIASSAEGCIAAVQAHHRLAAAGDAETAVNRRLVRAGRPARQTRCTSSGVDSDPSERLAVARAPLGSASTFRRATSAEMTPATTAGGIGALVCFNPWAACPNAFAASARTSGSGLLERGGRFSGISGGRSRRPERANRDAHRLRVAAARAGPDASRGRAASARGDLRPAGSRAAWRGVSRGDALSRQPATATKTRRHETTATLRAFACSRSLGAPLPQGPSPRVLEHLRRQIHADTRS